MKSKNGNAVWILKMTAGGVDHYLSNESFAILGWMGGVATKGWVAKWGPELREPIGLLCVTDFTVTFAIDPNANPNMENIATSPDLEANSVELYLWFRDLDPLIDPPLSFGRYYVKDPVEIPDETSVVLGFNNESRHFKQESDGDNQLAAIKTSHPPRWDSSPEVDDRPPGFFGQTGGVACTKAINSVEKEHHKPGEVGGKI